MKGSTEPSTLGRKTYQKAKLMGGEHQLIFKHDGSPNCPKSKGRWTILAIWDAGWLAWGFPAAMRRKRQLPVLLSICWRVAADRHLLLISMNDRGPWLSEAGNLEWFRTWSHLFSIGHAFCRCHRGTCLEEGHGNLPAFMALTPNSAGCLSHQQQGAKPTRSCFWDSLLAEVSHFLSHIASFGVNKSKWRTAKLSTV